MIPRAAYLKPGCLLFIPAFVIFLLAYTSRKARQNHADWMGHIYEMTNSSGAVIFEHFVGGYGCPAMIVGLVFIAFGLAGNHHLKYQKPKNPTADESALLISFLIALITCFAYAFREAFWEAEELTLEVRSNFGQFIADKCLIYRQIESFGNCTREYYSIVNQQLTADLAGILLFSFVFITLLSVIAKKQTYIPE